MSGIATKVVEVVLAEQCGYFFWQSGYKEGVIRVGSFYFGDDIAGFVELAVNTVSGILFEIEISVRQFVGSRSGIIRDRLLSAFRRWIGFRSGILRSCRGSAGLHGFFRGVPGGCA